MSILTCMTRNSLFLVLDMSWWNTYLVESSYNVRSTIAKNIGQTTIMARHAPSTIRWKRLVGIPSLWVRRRTTFFFFTLSSKCGILDLILFRSRYFSSFPLFLRLLQCFCHTLSSRFWHKDLSNILRKEICQY